MHLLCYQLTMYTAFASDTIRSLLINNGFPSRTTGVITTWRAVARARGVAWVWHVLCSTALWAALRITREMTRSWTCHARSSTSHCSGRRSNILHHVSATVIITIWETAVVACTRARWELLWREACRGVVLVFVGVKGAAGYTATCGVADVWFGAWLCAYSYTLFLYWSFRS